MFKSRKGVSLFTVLIFMLIATIAGTATYKWLTSEGFSSASRMMMSEARASAYAGVDAARAWMTYHANETGAILRQYIVSGRKPVSLDKVLLPMAKQGQSFKVSLVGVEAPTASATYKVKIVSTGYSHDEAAVYSETAVLNVSGLYRVLRPVEEKEYRIDYNYAYFGGSTSFAGAHDGSAMLINGDWGTQNGSNPGKMEGDFIVTGTARLSGSNITVGGTACIGNDIMTDNGLWAGNLYVGRNSIGNQKFSANVVEDAYFDGNIEIGQINNPGFVIGGNLFVNKRLTTKLDALAHTINGNLCLGDQGSILFNGESMNYNFTVKHNVWIPTSYKNGNMYGILTNNQYTAYSHRIFGNTVGDKAYIKDGTSCYSGAISGQNISCSGQPEKFFQRHMNGNSQAGFAGFTTKNTLVTNIPDAPPFACGAEVKEYCNKIWKPATPTQKCGDAPYFVPDILKTGHEEFEKYAPTNKGLGTKAKDSGIEACKNLTYFSAGKVDNMNTCYSQLMADKDKRKKYLYNDYLVVRLESNENESNGADNASHKLNGKFLFIYESALKGNNPHFPQTESDARVFVYLKEGTENNTHINCNAGKNTPYNYFIFSRRNVGGLLGSCIWNGSFYGTATNCAKISDINGSVELKYDSTIINDMVKSGIVCEARMEKCGDPPPSSSSAAPNSSANENFDGIYDPYFIATGTQLHIAVESENKISKPVSSASAIEPSVIALPRVVYLNENSPGKLKDYVSVVALNGAKFNTEDIACTGNGAPSGTDKIYSNGSGPNPGLFNCMYTARGSMVAYESPFYVVVAGAAESTPMVHFDGDVNVDFVLGQANEGVVKLAVDGSGAAGEFEVSIAKSDLPNGWEVVHYADGSPVNWQTASDGSKFYVVRKPYSTSPATYPIFKVRASSSAASGMVYFALQSPQGCIIGGGSVLKSFNIKGSATFERLPLTKYCEAYPEECPSGSKYAIAKDLQDCPNLSGTWVRADGIGCEAKLPNQRWICDAAVGAANQVNLVGVTYDDAMCTLYNPEENNVVVNPQDDNSNPGGYKLYASLKRKYYTLHIDVKNTINNKSGVEVWTAEEIDGPYTQLGSTCTSASDGGCQYIVYAGMHVRLIPREEGRDHLAYWETSGDYLNVSEKSVRPLYYAVDQSRSYSGVFNMRDQHCFYANFSKTQIWCDAESVGNCVDQCKTTLPCNIDDGVFENAGWLIVNTNKGITHAPQIKDQKYITRSGNGHVLLMLNTVQAGSEGTFSTLQFVDVIKENQSNKQSELMNYGIVVRSTKNGSEYISVNFYGVGKKDAESTHARVCYLDRLEMVEGNLDHCQDKLVKTESDVNYGWPEGTPMNFVVNVTGDSLFATVSYASGSTIKEGFAKFDLKEVVKDGANTLNDEEHEFVGFKLGGTKNGALSAFWHSTKYADQCFDDPSVFCSFAAKYVGGSVPSNESVSPAVGYSSWFMDQNSGAKCVSKVSYFYNGCDMPFTKYGGFGLPLELGTCLNRVDADGPVERYLASPGLRLKKGEEYQFSYEGLHGFPHATRQGYVRNASIEVDCRAVNGMTYKSSCGEFYVGETHSCTQDIVISEGSPNHGMESFVIESPLADGMNLREATVNFYLDKNPGVTVRARFVDASNVTSDVVNLTEVGLNEVSYEKFADKFGFNPEKVKSVILVGSGSYSVDSIVSHCSYTLKARCGRGDAFYSGSTWRIKASIDPPQVAKKCKVESIEGITPTFFGDCNASGTFLRDDPGFLDRLNEGTEHLQYSFKVSVYDDPDAAANSTPKSTCVATTQEYAPIEISCSLDGSNAVVQEGAGVPAFVLSAENCPVDGCVYEMALSTGAEYAHSTNLVGQQVWQPGLNTSTKLPTGRYYYTAKIYNANKTKVLKSCNNVSFDVVAAQPATASSCKLENGEFSAFIDGSGNNPVNTMLVITDLQGQPVQSMSSSVNVKDYVKYTVPALSTGNYILSLRVNGDTGCSELYTTQGASSPLKVTCPADVTGQNPNSAISISPTATGCDGKCSWEVVGGSSGNTGNQYSTGGVSFYDNDGVDTKEYKFRIKRTVNDYELSAECGFKVTFIQPLSITVSCPGPITSQDPSTAISVSNAVSGCNGQCSWRVTGLTPAATGNNCSSVSFKDPNATGSKSYTFEATCTENGQSDSKNCSIDVSYASVANTIASGTKLSGGSYTISGWTDGWCSGNTRITVQQTKPVNAYGNCLEWVDGKQRTYEGNNQYNCQGKITVTYPFKVNIPNGKEIELRCN